LCSYFSKLRALKQGKEMEAIAMENAAIRKALTIEEMFWQSEIFIFCSFTALWYNLTFTV